MSRHNLWKVLGAVVVAMMFLASLAAPARAGTQYTWVGDMDPDRNWDSSVSDEGDPPVLTYFNWIDPSIDPDWGYPTVVPGADPTDTVQFSLDPGDTNHPYAAGDVYLNGDRTVAGVTFANTQGTYTLRPAGWDGSTVVPVPSTLTTGAITQGAGATANTINEIQTGLVGNGGAGNEVDLSVTNGTLILSGQIGTAGTATQVNGQVDGGAILKLINANPTITPNNIVGTIAVAGEMHTQAGSLSNATAELNAGTLRVSGAVEQVLPGIYAGRLDTGYWNRTSPNPNTFILPDLRDMNYSGNSNPSPTTFLNGDPITTPNGMLWQDNSTWVYSGYYYEDDGNVTFSENVDDNTLLIIDGNVWLDDSSWNTPTFSNQRGYQTLSVGWHEFEVRFGQGGGGAGDIDGIAALGWSDSGTTSNNRANFLDIPASRLGMYGLLGDANVGGNVAVKGDSTIEVEGVVNMDSLTLHGASTTNLVKVGPSISDSLTFATTTIDDTTAGDVTLNVPTNVPLAGGALALGATNNTVTKIGDGTATFTTVTHPTNGGTFTVNANVGELAITGRMGDDTNSIALDAAVASGARLRLGGTTNNVTGTATVNGGRLIVAGAEGQSAMGTGTIVLNGGDLDLDTTTYLSLVPGLVRKRFDQFDGAAFPYARWDEMATATPTEQVVDTRIDYAPNLDGYTVTWEGYIYVPAGGTYNFQGGSDDEGWLDIQGTPGTWTTIAHPQVNDQYGSITLADAGYYKFRFGYAEGGGGDWGHVLWNVGGTYQIIDGGSDGDPATNYFYLGGSNVPYLGNDVEAHVSSTINTDDGAVLGTLSIDNGVALTTNVSTAGAYVAFEETVFTNVNTGDVEFVTNGEMRLGRLDDGGNAISLVKSGGGALVLDWTDVVTPGSAAATTVSVAGGTLAIVGENGGADPMGGATLQMNGPASVVLSSKNGDADVGTTIDINADVALTAKKAYSGTETGVNVNLTGAIDIQAGTTLFLATADGYKLSINTTPTGGGKIAVADDSTGRIGPGGSTANVPELGIGARARFEIATSTGLDPDTLINIGADSFFDIIVGQDPGYFPNEINVASFGALGGNLNGADFGAGGNQNVFLSENSVMAVDPAVAAWNPTRAEMGDEAILFVGVVDLAGNYQNLGDAGPGSLSVYKGAIISDGWTPAGDFVGTLSEAAGAAGFEVGLRRNQRFGAATFDAAAGNEVLITGDTKMTIATALAGTADTFRRLGTAPSAGNRGGLGRETLEFVTTSNLVTGGRTISVENGGMFLDQANDMRRAVNNDSTMNIGPYASLVLNDNIQTGQWNILENGYVYSNSWDRLISKDAGSNITFENGSFFMYAYGEFKYVDHGLPLDKSVNIIVNDGWMGANPANQIRLGDGALLTTPWNSSQSLNDRSGDNNGTGPAPSGGVFLTDPNGDGTNPTVNSVRIAKSIASGDEDRELCFELMLDLRNNRTVSDDSRATLYIGMQPGTEPWLPAGNPSGGGGDATRDWTDWAQKAMEGWVVIRSGREWNGDVNPWVPAQNWGKGSIIAGDIIIESGSFRLGDGWDQRGDIDVDINGEIITKNGGRFYMQQRPATPMAQLIAGTLGTANILENGGRADYQMVHKEAGYITVNEQFTFRDGGSDNVSHLVMDIDEGMSGGNVNGARGWTMPNVRIEEGADVAVTIHNVDHANMRWDLVVAGDSRIQRQWGGWQGPSYNSITNEGTTRHTLAIGAGGTDGLEFNLYGAIGDYVTLDLQLGFMDIMPGASLAPETADGGGAIINSWGNKGRGEDSHIRVIAGNDGSGFSGGTFNFSGYQDMVIRVNDGPDGQPRIVNEVSSRVNILADNGGQYRGENPNLTGRGTDVHGWLQVGRTEGTTDTGNNGVGYFSNIHLGNAATLELVSWDGDIWTGDITLDGATGGLFNWNNDNENSIVGIHGNPSLAGNEVLTVYGASRTRLTGTIEGADVIWNNSNCMHIENDPNGLGTVNIAPDVTLTTTNQWMWGDFFANPVGGKFVNMVGWPKYGTPWNENLGNWWQEDWRGTYYIYYGGYVNDGGLGEAGWGEDIKFELGGGARISLRGESPAGGQPNEVNKFLGRIDIYNNNTSPDGDWVKDLDARLLTQRQGGPDNNWGTWGIFSDVHIHEGAQVRLNTDWTTIQVDLVMEGNGKVHIDTNEGVIGSVNGNPDVAGNETLSVIGWTWTRYNGLIGGVEPVNVSADGRPDGGQDWAELRDGFEVAPGSRWSRGKGDLRIMVYQDITSPNGGGDIDVSGQVVRGDWWWDEGSVRFEYGMGNGDLAGDNGHGAGAVFKAGGQTRFRLDVDDNATAGTFNVNKLDARINVVNNVAGYDVFLQSERRADISGIWAKAQFSDVHIVEEGAEICMQTAGGSWVEADITLDGVNGRVSNWDSPDLEIIKVTSATPQTLTIDTHAGNAGWWSTPHIDLTLNGLANAEFDATGGGAYRVLGMHLNGQTVTVKRSSASGLMVEMWPACNNDPNGLIDILGWDNGAGGFEGAGLQVRMNDSGGVALTSGTQVQIHNNQVLGGFVREKLVEAVQAFEAPVKVMASVTDTDAILRSVKSDVADEGDTPGLVKFHSVTMESGSKAELQINDNTKMFLADVALEGNAEIWQNSTQTRAFIGDVSGTGALTIAGSGWTRLVGDVAGTVNLNAWGVLQTTGTVSGTLNVNGVAIVQKAMAGDGINVNGGGVLVIADAGFTPGTMTIQNGGAVALLVDNSWTDTANAVGMSAIMIAKEGYAGTLTLNRNDTVIGGEWTDRASLTSALTGSATTVTLAGGGEMLTIGDGVLSDFSGSATDVNIAQNVRLAGSSSHSGTTAIASPGGGQQVRAVVLDAGALGGGGGGGTVVTTDTTLDVQVAGLTESAITVAGGTVTLHGDLPSALVLGGGTIQAVEDVQATGALTDGADMTLAASAGKTLTFTGGIALTGDREWTVPTGTVEMGEVTGAQGLTKLGAGTLKLAGAPLTALTVGDGAAAGGLVVVANAAALPGTVLINAESAYGVGADHGYGEVDLVNSAGCLALGADTSADLAMLNEFVTVGASADAVYTGTLTPYDDGVSPVVYRLGGGGAQLTVQTELTDVITGTDVQIGRDSPGVGDITHQGEVLLDSPTGNSFTGILSVYGYAGITSWNQVSSGLVQVYEGGSLDLGGLVVPELHNVDLSAGGGVSSNGSTLTTDDIYNLFNGAGEVVLGGGMFADGITTVADGALVDWDLRKIGPNEVVLANPGGWSSNDGISLVTVEGGTLTVSELTSLGNTFTVRLTGDGRLNVTDTGMDDVIETLEMDNTATLEIAGGETVMASGLALLSNSARVTLTGGGTLDLGDTTIQATANNGAQIEIAGQSTLVARYGNEANQRTNLFRVRGGSTLKFNTADYVNMGGGQMQSIGWLDAGATLEFGDGLDQGSGQWQTIYGNPGLTLDVDPIGYDENAAQADHVIRVGTGTRIDFWNGSGTSSLRSASFTDSTGISHKPVAYVRKEGAGRMNVYGGSGIDAGDTNAARIFHWTVAGGTLNGIDEGGLGADAYSWVFNDKRPTIANQHLEGIMVESGATLEWTGTHGFLSASQWPVAAPAEQGDGFNAGEFRMQNNTTLRGNNLRLGFQQTYTVPGSGDPTDTYLCYPTIEASGATNIALGGTIRFDSGIERVGSGPLNVTVTDGDVSLINRLAGAIGTDVIDTLTHQSGTTRIGNPQTTMTDTQINGGMFVFQPTAAIAYNGSIDLNAGQIRAATGETDLGSTIVRSTVMPSGYANGVLYQEFYDGLDGDTGPDTVLLEAMGAGFDTHTATFWKAGSSLDYPGNADSNDPAQPWYEADGSITKDHAGVDIVMADSDQIGFRATGELMIDTAGTYAFSTRSDDGTKLWVDGQVVVNNDFWQGFTERNGTIYLDAGPHSFAVGFYEGGGGAGFDVRWDPTGGTAWTAIPADRFRYAGGAATDGILTVEAPATLKARGVQGLNRLVVNGTLVLGEATSMTRELMVATAGKVDLTSGNLVVDYDLAMGASPFDAVVAQVQAGLGTGTWDGTHGITSSVANASERGIIGIGVVENSDADLLEGTGRTRLYDNLEVGDGVALDESSVLVKVTYWGDANLDGVIDANDYDQIDRNYLFQPAVATWSLGDFNYDGVIDANDYDKIDRAYLFQGAPMGAGVTAGAGGAVPVATPEPATLALLGLGAVAALARRRRTR